MFVSGEVISCIIGAGSIICYKVNKCVAVRSFKQSHTSTSALPNSKSTPENDEMDQLRQLAMLDKIRIPSSHLVLTDRGLHLFAAIRQKTLHKASLSLEFRQRDTNLCTGPAADEDMSAAGSRRSGLPSIISPNSATRCGVRDNMNRESSVGTVPLAMQESLNMWFPLPSGPGPVAHLDHVQAWAALGVG